MIEEYALLKQSLKADPYSEIESATSLKIFSEVFEGSLKRADTPALTGNFGDASTYSESDHKDALDIPALDEILLSKKHQTAPIPPPTY